MPCRKASIVLGLTVELSGPCGAEVVQGLRWGREAMAPHHFRERCAIERSCRCSFDDGRHFAEISPNRHLPRLGSLFNIANVYVLPKRQKSDAGMTIIIGEETRLLKIHLGPRRPACLAVPWNPRRRLQLREARSLRSCCLRAPGRRLFNIGNAKGLTTTLLPRELRLWIGSDPANRAARDWTARETWRTGSSVPAFEAGFLRCQPQRPSY